MCLAPMTNTQKTSAPRLSIRPSEEPQCYSGIAPVTEASGKRQWVHIRLACPKFVRQTFHEFAASSIQQSEWARAFYEHQRNEKQKSHHAAVRSLAFKWVRIIYRCWKDGKPYETRRSNLQSLRPRGSLLGEVLGLTTGVGWKSIAGFQKLSENNTWRISSEDSTAPPPG